jgi:translation initiation factor 4B
LIFCHLAPATRKKLELKPRSAEAPAPTAATTTAAKSSPFGAAKAIDSDAAIRRVEEKLKQEQQEKKEAADKIRKEKEAKKPAAKPEEKAAEPEAAAEAQA